MSVDVRSPSRSLHLHPESQKELVVQDTHAHSGSGICSSSAKFLVRKRVRTVLACPLAARPPSYIHARFPPFAALSECTRSGQPAHGRRARSSRCRSQSSASWYVAAPAPPKLLLMFSPLPMSRSVGITCRASSTTSYSASSECVLPVTPLRLASSAYESSHTPRSPGLTTPAPRAHAAVFSLRTRGLRSPSTISRGSIPSRVVVV